MLSAKLFVAASQDGRGADRRSLDAPATMRDATETPITVAVRDLSSTGVRFDCDRVLEIGQQIRIGISGLGVQAATIVHRNGGYGCTFDRAVAPERLRAANVMDTVIPFDADAARPFMPAVVPAPAVEPYPRWVRVALLAGGSILGWWLILTLLG